MKNSAGFTLIEILVSIAVLSVIGILFLTVFSNSLRGGNKAQIMLAIKQNGQSVLENMDKTIRGADNVICVDSNDHKTIVIIKDGDYTRYRFIEPTASANGMILQDKPTKGLEADTDFINNVCTLTDPMNNAVILTDTNKDTGVSVMPAKNANGIDLHYFDRSQLPGSKDTVTVQFKVGQGVGVTAGTSSYVDPVTFKTTVQLR